MRNKGPRVLVTTVFATVTRTDEYTPKMAKVSFAKLQNHLVRVEGQTADLSRALHTWECPDLGFSWRNPYLDA